MNKTGKIPFFKSFIFRLLAIAFGPLVVTTIALSIVANIRIKKGMEEVMAEGIQELAQAVSAEMNDGNHRIADGTMYDGSIDMAKTQGILDAYVSGNDAELTIFAGDTRVITTIKDASGSRIVGTKCTDEVRNEVLVNGKIFTSDNVKINGERYSTVYIPFKNPDGKIAGMVFAGKKYEVIASNSRKSVNAVVVVAIIVFALSTIDIIHFGRQMASNLVEADEAITVLASGDLTVHISEKLNQRTDEIGSVGRAVISLKGSLKEMVGKIQGSSGILRDSGENLKKMSDTINSTSNEINATVEAITEGAVSESEEVSTTSKGVRDIGEKIEDIANGVVDLNQTADEMQKVSADSAMIVQELKDSNDKTTGAIEEIATQVIATNDSANKIRFAVEAISSIASQTNLLSLNASIEAARAGEAGRGFAVVASEIQKLAEQSSSSAKEIDEIVNALYTQSGKSVEVMKGVKEILADQEEKLTKTLAQFDVIINGISHSTTETGKIRVRAEKCNDAKEVIMKAMDKLNSISQDNSAAMEETAATMEELNTSIGVLATEAARVSAMAQSLDEQIQIFKV